MEYLVLKWIHIVSATLLFGTGLGSAYYKYRADREGDLHAVTSTNKNVVLADWIFTAPTVIIQPLTGLALVQLSGYTMTEFWLMASIVLFAIAGLCWLPVVYLQIRMRDLSIQSLDREIALPTTYRHYVRIWFWLGVPAFISLIVVFYLMVFRPVLPF